MGNRFGFALSWRPGFRVALGPFQAQLSRRVIEPPATQGELALQAQRLREMLEPMMLGDLGAASERVDAISVPGLASEQELVRAGELLASEGIVVVPDFAAPPLVDRIATRIREILARYAASISAGADTEDDEVVVDATGVRFKNYDALAGYPKTILNLRNLSGGPDAGMVDIFNFDHCSPDDARDVTDLLGSYGVRELLRRATGRTWTARNFNVYVNRGITNTRGFHVDSYGGQQIKVFLYLSDVKRIADGPYCYVLGSHRDEGLLAVNRTIAASFRLKATTDQFVLRPERVVPVLASRGSLIISQQSGVHRGIPQTPGAERLMAVMNFVGDTH